MGGNDELGIVVVGREVGAEVEAGALPCPRRHRGEEIRLHDAVLMVAQFGPRVGKEDEKAGKGRIGREHLEEEPGLGVDEMKVGEAGAVPFAEGAADAFADDVDADAQFVGVGLGVGGQEVSVATADFPGEAGPGREDFFLAGAEVAAAGLHQGEKLGGANGIFHGRRGARGGWTRGLLPCPTRLDENH